MGYYYLMLAGVKHGYEMMDSCTALDLREAVRHFKKQWGYLVKEKRYGRVIIVRVSAACFSKEGKWF